MSNAASPTSHPANLQSPTPNLQPPTSNLQPPRRYAINPFCVILLVPVVASVTKGSDQLTLITRGAFVSACSVFLLCLGAHYWNAVGFVLLLSVGEAIYSPKVWTPWYLV